MSLEQELQSLNEVVIQQRRELAEFVGFETRNKYSIESTEGRAFGFAAEQGKGLAGFIFRQFLGHWRSFEILIFGVDRQLVFRAVHPFRIFFQRLELKNAQGAHLGALQRRFSIFTKSFDLEDSTGRVVMTVRSGFFKVWTFPFLRDGREVAEITKKWGGMLKEVFTDADRFLLRIHDQGLPVEQRALLLAAGLYIDLMFFEDNNRSPLGGILDVFGS